MKTQQVRVLSNLRPETVRDIQDVPFRERIMAMPGVASLNFSIHEVLFIGAKGEDGDEIDVERQMRLTPDTGECMVVMDKYIVAGGLCYDHDSGHCNPMDDDGNGQIYHRGRRATGDEEASFYAAIGLDSNGERDMTNPVIWAEVARVGWKAVARDLTMNMKLMGVLKKYGRDKSMTVSSAIQTALNHGGEDLEDNLASSFAGKTYLNQLDATSKELIEALAETLKSHADTVWEKMREFGAVGNPLAVTLDIYEHGGTAYSVSGTGMNCRWDTSPAAAIWVPCNDAFENIAAPVLAEMNVGRIEHHDGSYRYTLDDGVTWAGGFSTWPKAFEALVVSEASIRDLSPLYQRLTHGARQYCKGIVEEYTSWCNGDVYGVVVYAIDRATGKAIDDADAECWGYIGHQYAETTLEEEILSKVMELASAKH